MNGPKTEVVLCTYNGSAFITDQLASIHEQTHAVDRISVVDDASSDDTIERVRAFVAARASGRHAPAVDVRINPSRIGYRDNFAQAIARATGDVLFLCDQDDVWTSRKVEVLLQTLESNGADMAFSDGSIIDRSGRIMSRRSVLASYGLAAADVRRFGEAGFERLMKRNYINGAACAIRRTTAQQALPLPHEIPHDYWIAIWCALHGGIAATPERLYGYRQHEHNAIGVGTMNPLYLVLGIWRHSRVSRARELRIWKAVVERIPAQEFPDAHARARRKVEWLERVVAGETRANRGSAIMRSALDGSYRRYSSADALLRDIVSLLRA